MKTTLIALILLLATSLTSVFATAYPGRGDYGRARGLGRGQPTESFRQSCQVIRESRYNIEAYCGAIDGRQVYSNFDRSYCTGDIANIDGYLECRGGYNQAFLPSGSYLNSCTSCSADSRSLECQCRGIRGNFKFSLLNYRQCYGDIANIDGTLMCSR